MRVFHMLYRKAPVHRTKSVSVTGHELIMGVSSKKSDQKQQNIFGRISLFWSVALQGHGTQRNGCDHDWLIEPPVSKVQ